MIAKEKTVPAFLTGGGEMGELTRSFDWSKTAIGSPDKWPQSLRIAVRIMLDCPFGMYIAWGNEYIQLYNDGYRPILGATKHPQALGISTRTTFEEIWTTVKPMFDGVMQGTPVGVSDFVFYLDRNGYVEECVFDFSYSPIRLEDGEVGGVLVTVIETTEKVNNLKKLAESNDQLNFAIEATDLGTWDYNPLTNNFTGNNRLKNWFGLPHNAKIDLSKAIEVMAEKDRNPVADAIQKALQYESGGLYDIEYSIINPVTKQERIVRAKGRAWFGEDKIAYRFNGTLQDITIESIAKTKIEESEKRLRDERMVLYNSFMNAPAGISILKGATHIYEFANTEYEKLVDRKITPGKTVQEHFPEIEQQGLIDILNKVFSTGEAFIANEFPVELINKRTGKNELHYYNSVLQPLKDENGKTERILTHGVEVTEQVTVRKQIEAKEQDLKLYKHMADNATEPFILMREDGTFAYLNDLALQRWGYTKEESENIRVPDVDPIYNDEVFKAAFAAAQKEKIPQFETLHKKKDGTIYPVEINMGGLSLEGKLYMFAIARDITERKKLEEAALENENKIRSFILQAPVAMCLYRGPQYIIEIINEELLTLWDKPLESVINKPVFEALPEAREQGFDALLEKVYTTGEKFEAFGMRITLTRNGKPKTIYVNLVYQAYREADGTISGIVEVVSDVTEQVEARIKIEQSEYRFKLVLRNSSQIVFTQDINLKHTWIYNPLSGFDDATIIGKDDYELHDPENAQILTDIKKQVLETAQGINTEVTLTIDGQQVFYDLLIEPIKNDEGKVEGISGVALNITEKVIARKQIEASETFNRTILESSPDCLKVLDKEGRIQFMNFNGLCQMEIDDFGSFENKDWRMLWGKENEVVVKASINKALKGETAHFTAMCPTAKGTPKWWDVVVSPVGKPGEPVQQIISVSRDITEKKEAEEKIVASENQFRTFADSIQNLAWIANAEGWIYWYNQLWYDYTGTTLEEMEGLGWQKVHHPDHIEKIIELSKDIWKKDEAWELTFPLRRHDGEYRWFLTRAYPVKDSNGNIERWIGTNTDVTEQKNSTEELEQKVNERTVELEIKNHELELSNAELKSFSYVASHDLKEPLRKIQAFSKRIIDTENFSEKTQDYFNRIISAGERMQNLIDSLLDLSRANSSELDFVPCNLNKVIEEVKSDLQFSISEKQATIEHDELPVIMGGCVQISQLITNLLDNAIKYSQYGIKPLIKITSSIIEGEIIEHPSANKQKKYHAIKFEDNGIGFEQAYENKIFELFQRLHTKNEYSGTGIGLGIVKKIITNHNGFITAKGKPNVGSIFTIYIPTA
ncbi:MAG: PAS domain-containing protein [Ferruginibacter sp.]